MSQDQKLEIYTQYMNGDLSTEELAEKYNLDDEEMFMILFEGKEIFKQS